MELFPFGQVLPIDSFNRLIVASTPMKCSFQSVCFSLMRSFGEETSRAFFAKQAPEVLQIGMPVRIHHLSHLTCSRLFK